VFATKQMEYLGHVITKEGVATDPHKVTAILQWPVPTTIKQLRSFLGLTGIIKSLCKVIEVFADLLLSYYRRTPSYGQTRLPWLSSSSKTRCPNPLC